MHSRTCMVAQKCYILRHNMCEIVYMHFLLRYNTLNLILFTDTVQCRNTPLVRPKAPMPNTVLTEDEVNVKDFVPLQAMRVQSWRCGLWGFCSTLCCSVRTRSVMSVKSLKPNSGLHSTCLQVKSHY